MNRCSNCKCKTHILLEHNCGLKVCLKCKDPDTHKCTFDFKLVQKFRLAMNNPEVKAKKLEHI
uniref:AN1-type domain-containing protein n=1 Tax=viral metagenome TaxID=1070528 RepID=A0A6C0AIS2_9ZZZZ